MGIKISYTAARERLADAFEWAASSRPVPESWVQFTEQTFQMPAKTYTVALGTVLLARATDDNIDPLSIKATYGTNTYSLRNLGHQVLVPAAQALGFSIRNRKREPLNNQPFFRYDHMSTIDRVRDKAGHSNFIDGITKINGLDRDQALAAFAAFLCVAIFEAQRIEAYAYAVEENELPIERVIATAAAFLEEGNDRPRRTQALVAAAFDVTHNDVRSRILNDPSRDFPGDVQAFEDEKPILAAEVRAKAVPATEVEAFVFACREAGIDRAFMIVLWPAHKPLPREELCREAFENQGVLLTIVEQVADLLLDAFAWSDTALDKAVSGFTRSVLERLVEIEATHESLTRWTALVGAEFSEE